MPLGLYLDDGLVITGVVPNGQADKIGVGGLLTNGETGEWRVAAIGGNYVYSLARVSTILSELRAALSNDQALKDELTTSILFSSGLRPLSS